MLSFFYIHRSVSFSASEIDNLKILCHSSSKPASIPEKVVSFVADEPSGLNLIPISACLDAADRQTKKNTRSDTV